MTKLAVHIGFESLQHKKNRKTHKQKLLKKPHKFEVNPT
jgi:hypothetical protein